MVKSLAKNPRTWDSGMIRRNKVQKIINKNIEIQHGYPQKLLFLKNKTCPIQHFRFLGILDHFILYISDTVYFYHKQIPSKKIYTFSFQASHTCDS